MNVLTISTVEFQRDIGRYQDLALRQPVAVTCDGREVTVLISADEYRRLKRRDREVLSLDDFTDEDIEAIRNTEPSPESEAFNHELDD